MYFSQVYIIAGGTGIGEHGYPLLSSTWTLLKHPDGPRSDWKWRAAADLPSARTGLSGVGLDNGRFLVTGQ